MVLFLLSAELFRLNQSGGEMIKQKSNWLLVMVLLIFAITLSGCRPSQEEVGTENMILIPEGKFVMGRDADQAFASCLVLYDPYHDLMECALSWFEDEEPIHTVHLDDYYIDKYEVTNAEYQACVEDGVCVQPEKFSSYSRDEYFGNPEYGNYPVIYVNWYDAKSYCEWRGARLPTEAEWEKAARGTDGRIYPWGDSFDGTAGNFCNPEIGDNRYSDTAPVGSFPEDTSPYGVMDMAGNVFEWIADWYEYDYYDSSPSEDPQGPTDGKQRVMKSCNWSCVYTSSIHASDRFWAFPDYKWDMYGFRCAASAP